MRVRFVRWTFAFTLAAAMLIPLQGPAPAAPTCFGEKPTKTAKPDTVTFQGTEGDDVLLASAGGQVIHGLGGNDLICAGGGDDFISPGPGSDRVSGGPGSNDEINFARSDGAVVAYMSWGGRPGKATILGDTDLFGADIETMQGSGFDDTLWPGAGATIVLGGEGRDLMFHLPGTADFLDGEGGTDTISFEHARGSVKFAMEPHRAIYATPPEPQTDEVHRFEQVIGSYFDDEITGTLLDEEFRGSDSYSSGDGNKLNGGAGNDVLVAGVGPDIIYGDEGDDQIKDMPYGNDYFDGGPGNDVITTLVTPPVSQAFVDDLIGGEGNDSITAHNSNDRLSGGDGNDQLFGADGNDELRGGSGKDDFSGGLGVDTCPDYETETESLTGCGYPGWSDDYDRPSGEAPPSPKRVDITTFGNGPDRLNKKGEALVIATVSNNIDGDPSQKVYLVAYMGAWITDARVKQTKGAEISVTCNTAFQKNVRNLECTLQGLKPLSAIRFEIDLKGKPKAEYPSLFVAYEDQTIGGAPYDAKWSNNVSTLPN